MNPSIQRDMNNNNENRVRGVAGGMDNLGSIKHSNQMDAARWTRRTCIGVAVGECNEREEQGEGEKQNHKIK